MNFSGGRVGRGIVASVAIALTAALGTACGSSGNKGSSSTTTTVRRNQHPLTPAAKATARRWCSVRLGSTPTAVKAVMGAPHGSDARKHPEILPRGTTSLEWDSAPFVFVASFKKDKATMLQAYNLSVGPIIGAYGLPCRAVRQS